MSISRPSYLELHEKGELQRRADLLNDMMSECRLCAHECKVNRVNGGHGFCRAPSYAVYSSAQPHGGEERPLSGNRGSGTVFFTYCNSRCIYCQNYDISQLAHGEMVSETRLARIFLKLQKIGCHNINFVTPAHFLPHIMKALVKAADEGLEVPLVYNSNGYDSLEVLKLLDGVIDIYLPDLKFSDEHKALRLTRMPSYPQKARAAIAEMYRQVGPLKVDDNGIAYRGVIVRHLVLPNNYAGTGKVLEWLADVDEDIQISLMGQYYPAYHANTVQQISRRITWEEYESAAKTAAKLGLRNVWTQNIFLSCGA